MKQPQRNAGLGKHGHLFEGQAITLLGDDLYSRQPMCQNCLEANMNFIFTCLPSSHPSLYQWLDYIEKMVKCRI
ncbi:MAG: hypothetical protein M1G31_32410 [Pseudanabaena sp. Salubria-1]|nr:hypothetical protein [Pseudanabaena sp. Salubria-1]